jgi:hypothetical protein
MEQSKLEEKWEAIFSNFMNYLSLESVQKKIKVASDLLPEMIYEHVKSPDRTNIGRSLLWKGNYLTPKWSDAQINLEYSDMGKTYVQIRYHQHLDIKGKIYDLNNPESWVKDV